MADRLDEIREFLRTSPVFRDVTPEELGNVAALFRFERHPAGSIILRRGVSNQAVYFLYSGLAAVRIQRGEWRETVAYLRPPDFFGELSFLTDRAVSADVEVMVDAEVLVLPREAVPKLPAERDAILRGLLRAVAERLHETVVRGAKVPDAPVVLLRAQAGFEAPRSFANELARSLARQTSRQTLLIEFSEKGDSVVRPLSEGASFCQVGVKEAGDEFRSSMAEMLSRLKSSFENIILSCSRTEGVCDAIRDFANYHGFLLGPNAPDSMESRPQRFVVQSAAGPTRLALHGTQQLLFDAAESETAFLAGRPVTARFQRTVDSIARCIAGIQVGIALGGGAAWGWAHIGVLEVIEEAGLPIDVVSGCSMGSLIGAFRCAGKTLAELREIADYWKTRTIRFVEWKLWRMCLLNERVVRKVFRQYWGDTCVNHAEIPYWANAVDIQSGKEYTVQNGLFVECVRASIALPGLLPPARRENHLLVDAGIMDPVPVNLVRRMGCHYAIGVNAMARLESQKMRQNYPWNAFDVMTRCMFVMGHEIGQARAEQAANIVFTPSLGEISMLEFARAAEIIQRGRIAAEEHLPAILEGYERLKAESLGRPVPNSGEPVSAKPASADSANPVRA